MDVVHAYMECLICEHTWSADILYTHFFLFFSLDEYRANAGNVANATRLLATMESALAAATATPGDDGEAATATRFLATMESALAAVTPPQQLLATMETAMSDA